MLYLTITKANVSIYWTEQRQVFTSINKRPLVWRTWIMRLLLLGISRLKHTEKCTNKLANLRKNNSSIIGRLKDITKLTQIHNHKDIIKRANLLPFVG